MTNTLSLGQVVYFGSRKAIVIERAGLYVSVVVFDRGIQRIMECVPARVFSLVPPRNVRRKLGQSAIAAIVTHLFGGLPVDRSVVFAGLFALIATASILAAFIACIAGKWVI